MPTFWRLLGFLRPYRRGVIWSFLLAFGSLGATVLIPYLTGLAINAIRAHHHHALTLLAVAIGVAGLGRLVLSVFRRLVAGRVSLGVEMDLRNGLYEHLQQLELSFFDRQQTGQLMSRATVDLQSVRFFLGYGLIFIAQSLVTILLAAVAMFLLQPGLAAISLAPVPFVVLIANRYGHKSRPAMQEAQQRIAELTADVEENVSGVRVVKAFAQEDRQLHRFQHTVQRVFEQQVLATRIQAFYGPMISFLPNLGLGAILLFGGREVINGSLLGRCLHRLLRLPADADLPHAHAGVHARRRPALDRLGRPHLPDPRPRARDRLAARRAPAARRRRPGRSSAASGLTFEGSTPPCPARRQPRGPCRPDSGPGGGDGLGQVRARPAPAPAL